MSKLKKFFTFLLFNFVLGATHLNAILSHIAVYQNREGKTVVLLGEYHDNFGTNPNRTRDIKMVIQLIRKIENHYPRTVVRIVFELNKDIGWLNRLIYYFRKNKSLLETIYSLPLIKTKIKLADFRHALMKELVLNPMTKVFELKEDITLSSLSLQRDILPKLHTKLEPWQKKIISNLFFSGEEISYENLILITDHILEQIKIKISKLHCVETSRTMNIYIEMITRLKDSLIEDISLVQTTPPSKSTFNLYLSCIQNRIKSISMLIADSGFLYNIMKALQKLDTVIFIGGFLHTSNLATELTKLGFEPILNEENKIALDSSATIDDIMQDCYERLPDQKIKYIFQQIRSIAFPNLPPEEDAQDDENTTSSSCSNGCLLATAAVGAAAALTTGLLMYSAT